jgi:hypothetical protein
MACWKVHLAYGSTLHIGFGDQLDGTVDDPEGSISLSLYADDWRIEQGGRLLTESISVDREEAEGEVAERLAGATLEAIRSGGSGIELSLSRDVKVRLWRPDDSPGMAEDDDLLHCFLPNGRILCFNVRDQLYLSADIDEPRAAAWRRTQS